MKQSWINNKILAATFIVCLLMMANLTTEAQCSICTRTAEQMGEKPAKELNAGILYLAFTPLAIVAVIGYKWWKKNKPHAAE